MTETLMFALWLWLGTGEAGPITLQLDAQTCSQIRDHLIGRQVGLPDGRLVLVENARCILQVDA